MIIFCSTGWILTYKEKGKNNNILVDMIKMFWYDIKVFNDSML